MSEFYCDYKHKRFPDFRMVLPKDASMPGSDDDWELIKTRPAAHLSADGRAWVDKDGYAIIQVHIPLAEIKSL